MSIFAEVCPPLGAGKLSGFLRTQGAKRGPTPRLLSFERSRLTGDDIVISDVVAVDVLSGGDIVIFVR